MTEATDEEVVLAKRSLDAGHPLPIGLQVKLLARLERVEGKIKQIAEAVRQPDGDPPLSQEDMDCAWVLLELTGIDKEHHLTIAEFRYVARSEQRRAIAEILKRKAAA